MSAGSYGRGVSAELRGPQRELRRRIPETWAGFGHLHDAAMAPGAVDARTKELIALALSVEQRCDGCIAAHARGAAARGATSDEVAEVLGVVLLMCGGPATAYAPRALAAFEEFCPSQERGVP